MNSCLYADRCFEGFSATDHLPRRLEAKRNCTPQSTFAYKKGDVLQYAKGPHFTTKGHSQGTTYCKFKNKYGTATYKASDSATGPPLRRSTQVGSGCLCRSFLSSSWLPQKPAGTEMKSTVAWTVNDETWMGTSQQVPGC